MNRDFKDLLAAFTAQGVEYLVVGAHALAAHGHVRATKDLDVWIKSDTENAERALKALVEFGAPLHDLTTDDLTCAGLIYQIGIEPLRIDVMTTIDGVKFDDAWPNRLTARIDDQAVPVISRADLIKNKLASGRTQDRADVERLEGEDKQKSS